jgi:hypothetical protein
MNMFGVPKYTVNKLHDVFLVGWLGHLAYGVDLRWVGFNALVPDHEAQEQSGGDTEDTLCWVELPLELSQIGEGFGEVGDDLVFHCGLDVLPYLGLQALLDFLLVCCSSVFQAKGHDLVAINAMGAL